MKRRAYLYTNYGWGLGGGKKRLVPIELIIVYLETVLFRWKSKLVFGKKGLRIGENVFGGKVFWVSFNCLIKLCVFAETLTNEIRMHIFRCHPTKDFICDEFSASWLALWLNIFKIEILFPVEKQYYWMGRRLQFSAFHKAVFSDYVIVRFSNIIWVCVFLYEN